MEIADFLLARIVEDEAVARDVIEASPWPDLHLGDNALAPEWPFAERFDPARVLAECEAKRRIVEAHTWVEYDDEDGGTTDCEDCLQAPPCRTVRLLALPYADHPDYEPAWKP